MADPDYSGLEHWKAEQEKRVGALSGGGGGDRFDPMLEPRVAALEKGFERVEKKLDMLLTDVAEMKGRLSAMPTAATFGDLKGTVGELKGRVDSLPTTARIASLLGIAVAFLTLVAKWGDILAFFHR